MSKRRDAVDPVVADLLGEAERRERIRRKPKAKQKKARRDAERNRVTYDIPPDLEEVISELAEREGLSKSSTAALLLAEGARQYASGDVTFNGNKSPARHPLYDWLVDSETITGILTGKRSLRG